MSDEAGPSAQLTFNIKSSSDQKYVVTVPETMTVLELKEKLSTSEYADVAADRQRLIYSGRVLKDPDVLSTYKIKDGNTVHMVKGAASNARQNPANSSVPGAGQAPSGVPTNLATGTAANDPMAQLTGARYAGFAQMPGAEMFGPDGGMGPPPNPEEMIRMLENPQFASQMQEAMNNPAVIQMLQNSPMFRDNPMMRQMLENPMMRQMLFDPALMRQSAAMLGNRGGRGGGANAAIAPGVTDTTPASATGTATTGSDTNTATNTTAGTQSMDPWGGMGGMFGQGAGGANPFSALFGNAPSAGNSNTTGTGAQGQGQAAQPNPFASLFGAGGAGGAGGGMPAFNPEYMQQMMQNFGMGGGAGTASLPAAPQDTRPPEEMYAEQLRQLNEMGFYEFERNVRALRMAGGNVQGAIEILFSGN